MIAPTRKITPEAIIELRHENRKALNEYTDFLEANWIVLIEGQPGVSW
jgi:hypothetical protein